MEPLVLTKQADGVETITINRPEKLNALNAEVISSLHTAFDNAANDKDVRVVVITGAGERAFVAGADIAELQDLTPDEAREFLTHGHALMNRIESLGKPVIAAINGFALGGGCELALSCTLRVAAETARLGLPEVNLGLLPGYGGTQRLARLIGRGRALQLMLTGSTLTAAQAEACGLVSNVVPATEFRTSVHALASSIASGAPLAMRNIMRAVHQGADLPLHEGLAIEIEQFANICGTQDMREGTSAFLEKRKPVFRGQ